MTYIAHILPSVAALGLGIAPSRGVPVQAQPHAAPLHFSAGLSGQVVNQQSRVAMSYVIYRSPSEAPSEFLKSDSQCGVIAIWTKSGP